MSDKTRKPLKVSSADEWRKINVEGEVVQLPSGFVVRLRPVSMDFLWKTGKIPDALTNIVASIISTGTVATNNVLEDAKNIMDLKQVLVEASMIEPKIAIEPDYKNNEISYFDLSSEDTEFVMSWAQRPQKELINFRTK